MPGKPHFSEPSAQLGVVINLAVVNDDRGAIRGSHRLMTGWRQVND
jgi:hypothetical protein